MKYLQLTIIAIHLSYSTLLTANCINKKPKVIQPLVDWEIVANNTAVIPTHNAFSGKKLVFSLTTRPKIIKNNVSIHPRKGEIHLKAKKADHFDIIVKAQNQCGAISTAFNVKIEEELF